MFTIVKFLTKVGVVQFVALTIFYKIVSMILMSGHFQNMHIGEYHIQILSINLHILSVKIQILV